MTIKLEKLVSELNLDPSGFNSGSKIALAATGALVAGIGLAVGAIGLAVKATFDWANDVDKLGDTLGGTNKQMAALAFVARKSGVGVDALVQANTIMEKGLLTANGTLDKTGISLYKYGINVRDANGAVKDQATLTEEVSKKYQQLSTQQERINFLTEIYGKSGGQLVDFFDTLANEGGIDMVTKKVEALGLAIDPARFEGFNRNLEELKLIGTGLAVSFTEKIMPALESFLNWFGGVSARMNQAFQAGGFKGLWDQLLVELGDLDKKFTAKIEAIDWAKVGTEVGNWIDKQMTNGLGGKNLLPNFVVALTDGLSTAFLYAALGSNPQAAWDAYFDNVHRTGDSAVRSFFITWEVTWTAAIRGWGIGLVNEVNHWVNAILDELNPLKGFGFSFHLGDVPISTLPVGGGSAHSSGSSSMSSFHGHASGGSFLIPNSYGFEGFMMGNGDTASGGEKVTITPKGQDSQGIDSEKVGDAIARRLERTLPSLLAIAKA